MDKAKHAVSSFLSKSGHHDTTVHESVAPSVQKETVKEQRREEKQLAKDVEVHQDHYHTSVQPVQDQEVLPEQHHHNLAAVEHRTHDHRNHSETKKHLHNEAAQFRDESVRAPAQHTTSTAAPEVAGQHVHHHVHETVQPVVHKETIEPHVIHTTVPVHETHHHAAKHHTASAMPAISMDEFKKHGGSLNGRDTVHDHFKGEPRSFERTGNMTNYSGVDQQSGGAPSEVTGAGVHSGHPSSHHHNGNTGTAQQSTGTTHGSKPSMLDRINPLKDSNGDGQKGFMK